jgi:hypothetical protein
LTEEADGLGAAFRQEGQKRKDLQEVPSEKIFVDASKTKFKRRALDYYFMAEQIFLIRSLRCLWDGGNRPMRGVAAFVNQYCSLEVHDNSPVRFETGSLDFDDSHLRA